MSLADRLAADAARCREDWGNPLVLAYGGYRHALREAALTIERRTLFSDSGLPRAVRHRWLIEGRLRADTQAALTAAIRHLEAAYARHNQNAVLYLGDGVTPTAHQLISAQTLGGVRVARPPSFPTGRGLEYSTFRNYTIELEADVALAGTNDTQEFSESLSFSGGGPRWAYLPTLAGPPVRQQLQQQTPYRVVQSGRAVGQRAYPPPANPIWPSAWHQDQGGVVRQLPRPHEYVVEWTYHFESAEVLRA